MEFKKPKSKKHAPGKRKFPLPVKNGNEIIGIFNGQNVTVNDWNAMTHFYNSGNFGKGSLSKGAPSYHRRKDDIPKIILQQQFENQAKWNVDVYYTCQQKYLGYTKNDIELSLESIDHLLQSSFGSSKESWKSWKDKQCRDSMNLEKEEKKQIDLSFFEFTAEENNYVDVELSKLVNGILQSKKCRNSNTSVSKLQETVVVLDIDSSQETIETLSDVNARLEKLPYIAEENLNLNLEESFFLKSVLGCLTIVDLNFSELNVSDLWNKFNAVQKNFIERYITYHYYRSKGWVVRSGLKFGGDYLLYKDGPDYFHASYLVKVLDRRKKFSWTEFIAMNRLVETFNKDLILSNVSSAKVTAEKESFPEVVKNCTVQEVLVRRWFPSKERLSKEDSSLSKVSSA